jgi:hypothetical protein
VPKRERRYARQCALQPEATGRIHCRHIKSGDCDRKTATFESRG